MKRLILTVCISLICQAWAMAEDTAQKTKVILDTDMVEIFDDGISMLMLAKDPNIELLGVTTVTGNTWRCEGTAYAIRQLEAIGRTDIPVYEGARTGLRPHRHASIESERKLFGYGVETYMGSFSYPEPAGWREHYIATYGKEPTVEPVADVPGAMFIVEQVRKYPGEVVIAAIGPCTNLALACRLAPDIVKKIKEVVYMGGAFFVPGNTTPNAEFNWWADPEAARICLGQPFNKQTVISLDICNKIPFDKTRWERIKGSVKNPILKEMFERNFLNADFERNPEYLHKIWDVIATALIQDPTLLIDEHVSAVDMSTDFGFSYGQSMAYPQLPPIGTQEAHIVMDVDKERLWKMVETYIANM